MVENFKLCGEPGKKYILKSLTESHDPWSTISELQSVLSLGSGRWDCALFFMDEMSFPRSYLYQLLFERLKLRLERITESMTRDRLLLVLKAPFCARFIAHRELRPVILGIIKRLKTAPKQYLRLLAKYNFIAVSIVSPSPRHSLPLNTKFDVIQELPIEMQRSAWEQDENAFFQELERIGYPLAAADTMPSSRYMTR
jgi:hypothetical protein